MASFFQMLIPAPGKSSDRINRVGFEDVLYAIKNPASYYLINTLPSTDQDCLIYTTLTYEKEESRINEILNSYQTNTKKIIVYGKNGCDDTIYQKYIQLRKLGIENVYIYVGGLFEWVLLRDVYGTTMFRTTNEPDDILKYRAPPRMDQI